MRTAGARAGVGQRRHDAANLAERRALEKAGFTREGVLRGLFWRDGGWRDGVLYSLLRTDPADGA